MDRESSSPKTIHIGRENGLMEKNKALEHFLSEIRGMWLNGLMEYPQTAQLKAISIIWQVVFLSIDEFII